MADKEDVALELGRARQDLERAIEDCVRRHGADGESIQINLNLIEEPDSGSREAKEKHPDLYNEIMNHVESFLAKPSVRDSSVSIYKLQALDSDGDGTVAVNVQYEYAVNPGMRGSERSVAGGTGRQPEGPSNSSPS